LRLDWPDRWLLVRASNTEPIIRVVAEAPSTEEAQSLCRSAQSTIESLDSTRMEHSANGRTRFE
jgi:phosphomannomutase